MKIITLDSIGEVTLRKSRLAKRLILKIDQKGKPVVSVPSYIPYKVAETFAKANREWILKHLPTSQNSLLYDGKQIGKSHTIHFEKTSAIKTSSRVNNTEIRVQVPGTFSIDDPNVQAEAQKAATRALRRQAEVYLPKILHSIAKNYGYSYREVRVKSAYTRWGSCSSNKVINLSIWLMQLPENLIEYVVCHELTHLNHMNHQAGFWNELSNMVPDYTLRRKALKAYRPTLM